MSQMSAAKQPPEGKEGKEGKKKHEAAPMALMVYPMKELIFKGPFTDVVTSPLSISNPTEKTIAFKMMVTSPKHYCCQPNVGYVKPGDTVELQVMVEPMENEKKIEEEKHKFMIQAMTVKDAPGDNNSTMDVEPGPDKELPKADEFWKKDHPKREIMYHKFAVAFHQPQQQTKENLEARMMDLTNRAAAEAAAEMERERKNQEAEKRERDRLLKKGKLTPEERARLEQLLALQQLAWAKQRLTGILRITPYDEVVFKGPFSEYACSTIRLMNPSDKVVYYKVLVNNPRHYLVKPAAGILKPGDSIIAVVILEQQDQYEKMEKDYNKHCENALLRDKFMIHSAYADNPTIPMADFWKKREQGMVHAHKLKIAIQLLNSDEVKKEKERREKLKVATYKNKDIILAGFYGRDSGHGYFLGKETVVGYLPPDNYGYMVNQQQNPQPTIAVGGAAGNGPQDQGATSVKGTTPIGSLSPGKAGPGGFTNVNNGPGAANEIPPGSAYGGGPLGGPGGSVRAMDRPAGGFDGRDVNNNNFNQQQMMLGPGGARGGSMMMSPDAANGIFGYAVPGNAYVYTGAAGLLKTLILFSLSGCCKTLDTMEGVDTASKVYSYTTATYGSIFGAIIFFVILIVIIGGCYYYHQNKRVGANPPPAVGGVPPSRGAGDVPAAPAPSNNGYNQVGNTTGPQIGPTNIIGGPVVCSPQVIVNPPQTTVIPMNVIEKAPAGKLLEPDCASKRIRPPTNSSIIH